MSTTFACMRCAFNYAVTPYGHYGVRGLALLLEHNRVLHPDAVARVLPEREAVAVAPPDGANTAAYMLGYRAALRRIARQELGLPA